MITIEELRKVYQASYSEVRQIRNHLNVSTAAADIEAAHEAGLLAVARFVADWVGSDWMDVPTVREE